MTSRRLLTLILFTILSRESLSRADEEALTATFQSISNPASEDEVFLIGVKEIRKSKPGEDELKVWQEIVKSDKFSAERRRIAVIQIVDRHCRSGMTLRELVNRICSKSWIGDGQIIKPPQGITGPTMCRNREGFTNVSVYFAPNTNNEYSKICFLLEGDVPKDALEECFKADESSIDSLPVTRLLFETNIRRDKGLHRTPSERLKDQSKIRN